MQGDSSATAQANRGWRIPLALLCLGILLYGALYSKNSISDPAYLIGYEFVYAVIFWGIFHAFYLRKRPGAPKGMAFLAVYAALFAGALMAATKARAQADTAKASIQRDFRQITASSTDAQGNPVPVELAAAVIPEASGEYGQIELLVRDYMRQQMAARNSYVRALDSIGWGNILDVQRIKHDHNLAGSRAIIAGAGQSIDTYENRLKHLMQLSRARIGELELSEDAKRAVLEGFDRGSAKSAETITKGMGLEREVLNQVTAIFRLLASSSRWTVRDDRIVFYDAAELARFNQAVERIREATEQEDVLRARSDSAVERAMQEW